MKWFFIALGAPFVWSLTNISDQYLVEKYSGRSKSPGALVLFLSLIGIFVAGFIGLFAQNVFTTTLFDKILLLSAGALTILWVILYLFALEIEDVSAVVPWFLSVPIFGYVLGYLFLGETLTRPEFIGSLIIFCGLIILFFDFSNKGVSKPKWDVALYMLPACFLLAVIGVIFKYVTMVNQFWISSFWEYAGIGATGLVIFIFSNKYRREFLEMIRLGKIKIFSLNVISEVLTIIGNLLTNYAILLAPVTLVYMVGSLQPAILLLMTLFATKFFPGVVKENMSPRVLVPKIVAIVVILAGSVVFLQ